MTVIFIETSVFTRQVCALLTEASYIELQRRLSASPDAGALLPGGGGCRKLRWKSSGGGKRGGVRVIYYWRRGEERILMLLVYSKSGRADLTPVQIRTLAALVKRELEGNSRG